MTILYNLDYIVQITKSTNSELQNYLSIAEAITRLLHPYAEVVIHNLKTNKIIALYNSFSNRKTGDSSLL